MADSCPVGPMFSPRSLFGSRLVLAEKVIPDFPAQPAQDHLVSQ